MSENEQEIPIEINAMRLVHPVSSETGEPLPPWPDDECDDDEYEDDE